MGLYLPWQPINVPSRCSCYCLITHTHPFNGPMSGTTQVSRYQKGKTNVDFTEARDSEWQWHQMGHVQVCTSLQTDNHASTPPLSFLQAGCPSCRPTNSVKALKAILFYYLTNKLCVCVCSVAEVVKQSLNMTVWGYVRTIGPHCRHVDEYRSDRQLNADQQLDLVKGTHAHTQPFNGPLSRTTRVKPEK